MSRAMADTVLTEPWMAGARFRADSSTGLYESYYLRGNHPRRPLAFWIRYTVLVPTGRPEQAIGELWAVFFDGESGRHVVAKEEHPISSADLAPDTLDVRIATARLDGRRAVGSVAGPMQAIGWDVTLAGGGAPMFLLPRAGYDRAFPSAKSLVLRPNVVFTGDLDVDGRPVDVTGWQGSLNHNWGTRHTDHYAFGQVAGFDGSPETFLEVVSARVRVGPVRLPMVTCLSLRHEGRTHTLVDPVKGLRVSARFGYFYWTFDAATDDVLVHGEMRAEPEDLIALNYYNPPGGIKHCLNTKIADCTLTLTDRHTGRGQTLSASRRALFEILTDHRGHGVVVRA